MIFHFAQLADRGLRAEIQFIQQPKFKLIIFYSFNDPTNGRASPLQSSPTPSKKLSRRLLPQLSARRQSRAPPSPLAARARRALACSSGWCGAMLTWHDLEIQGLPCHVRHARGAAAAATRPRCTLPSPQSSRAAVPPRARPTSADLA